MNALFTQVGKGWLFVMSRNLIVLGFQIEAHRFAIERLNPNIKAQMSNEGILSVLCKIDGKIRATRDAAFNTIRKGLCGKLIHVLAEIYYKTGRIHSLKTLARLDAPAML